MSGIGLPRPPLLKPPPSRIDPERVPFGRLYLLYLLLWRPNIFITSRPQEPRHLQLLADLEDSNIFTVVPAKKQHATPTEYEFCIKV